MKGLTYRSISHVIECRKP